MTTWLTRCFVLLLLVLPFVRTVAERGNGASLRNDTLQEPAVRLRAALAPAGFLDLPGQEEKVPGDKDKRPEGNNSTAADKALLKSAGFQVDGPGLLEFFRQRILSASADPARLEKLVRQLGSDSYALRQQASRELKAAGPRALPFLRKGMQNTNLEMKRRAQGCLDAIQSGTMRTQSLAAARLLALRRPGGAAAVVLAFLPLADDEILGDELLTTLAVVGLHEGKADPVLLKALKDAAPIKRSAAALVLGGSTDAQHRLAVRPLLADADTKVRLRAALALAKMQDVEAIPVLIDILAESPPAQCKQMEAVLMELAGPWAPSVTLLQDDDVSRRIRRGVWAAWWSCTDGPALLAEFRKRTPSAAEVDRFQGLVRKLHDSSVRIREQSKADLVTYGYVVLPVLWASVRGSDDVEKRRRVQDCAAAIYQSEYKKNERRSLPPVAYRLLAMRKPAGAVEALLAFLPWAVTQGMAGEVQMALAGLAVRDGKVDPALVRALDDPLPARRALAAEVLAKAGGAEQRPAVRKLLRDADPTVRLRVACALAVANEAVSILSEVVMKDGAIEITRPKIQLVAFTETAVMHKFMPIMRTREYIQLAKETVPAKTINSFVVTKEGKLEPLDAAKLADLLKKRTPVLIGNRADIDPRHLERMAPGTIYLSIPPGLFLPEPPKKPVEPNKGKVKA